MADENQVEPPAEQEVPKLSATEEKALAQGWRPLTEWEGDPDEWRDAKSFLDRGELFKKIDDQNRTIKEFKRTVEELKKHNSKIAEVEYKRALDSLKKQKKDALLDGDADAVIEIDERMAVVRDAQKATAMQPQTVQTSPETLNPVFVSWVDRNGWYNTNKAMRAYADRVGLELGNSGMSPTDILAAVEQEVKKEFADKFNNPRRATAPGVEGSSNKGVSKNDSFKLTDDERRVMQRFIRAGALTEKEYIEQIKATR